MKTVLTTVVITLWITAVVTTEAPMSKSISQAELTVMEILWSESPLAASDVADRLSETTDWNIRTVKTLLSRLVGKNALETTQDGRRYLYAPLTSRASYSATAAKRLSKRLFGGRAAPLVAHLAQGSGLSDEDIRDLEALIAELKK